jgi:hypothetical protein
MSGATSRFDELVNEIRASTRPDEAAPDLTVRVLTNRHVQSFTASATTLAEDFADLTRALNFKVPRTSTLVDIHRKIEAQGVCWSFDEHGNVEVLREEELAMLADIKVATAMGMHSRLGAAANCCCSNMTSDLWSHVFSFILSKQTIPLSKQRFWKCVTRENKTVRPDYPAAVTEHSLQAPISSILDQSNSTGISSSELLLYLEETDEQQLTDEESQVLLFFKVFDPTRRSIDQKLFFAGTRIVDSSIVPDLREGGTCFAEVLG